MNSSTQAQKGFKTFILTLVVSLVVFSAIYYVVNSDSPSSVDTADKTTTVIDSKTDSARTSTLGDVSQRTKPYGATEEKKEVAGASDAMVEDDSTSVFEELATTELAVEPRQVLAEGDESTADTIEVVTTTEETAETEEVAESTVPETGVSGPTLGLFFTLVALSLFAYIAFIGPRNIALEAFEKKVLEDLE